MQKIQKLGDRVGDLAGLVDLRSHSIRLVFIYSSNVAARSYPGDRASPLYAAQHHAPQYIPPHQRLHIQLYRGRQCRQQPGRNLARFSRGT